MVRTRSGRNERERLGSGGAQWMTASGGQSSGRGVDRAYETHYNEGGEQLMRNSHPQRLRSSSRPGERDLRDPATAQNTDYTPPISRPNSRFPPRRQ